MTFIDFDHGILYQDHQKLSGPRISWCSPMSWKHTDIRGPDNFFVFVDIFDSREQRVFLTEFWAPETLAWRKTSRWKGTFQSRMQICYLMSIEGLRVLGWVAWLILDREFEFGVRPMLFWSEFLALTLTMDWRAKDAKVIRTTQLNSFYYVFRTYWYAWSG